MSPFQTIGNKRTVPLFPKKDEWPFRLFVFFADFDRFDRAKYEKG